MNLEKEKEPETVRDLDDLSASTLGVDLVWHPKVEAILHDRIISIAKIRESHSGAKKHSIDCRISSAEKAWDLYSSLANWAQAMVEVDLAIPYIETEDSKVTINWNGEFDYLRITLKTFHENALDSKTTLLCETRKHRNRRDGRDLNESDSPHQIIGETTLDTVDSALFHKFFKNLPEEFRK